MFQSRTKHIKIDIHFIKEKVSNGTLDVKYISFTDQATYSRSIDQDADNLSKPMIVA